MIGKKFPGQSTGNFPSKRKNQFAVIPRDILEIATEVPK